MSEDVQTTTPVEETGAPIPFAPPKRRWRRPPRGPNGRPPKPKVRKLRLLLILLGLAVLAFISTVFGMMMAVASDLPQLENQRQYKLAEQPSFLTDVTGKPIGVLAPPNKQILVTKDQISTAMKDAIIAIEDKRFRTNQGVDIRGIARAFVADITGGARQGASTIAQQFVKVALAQQNNRTVFEKLREAALAQVDEGQDPHRVPQQGLLRERGIRDRVGGQGLLRRRSRLRRQRADQPEHRRL
jgi:penicillin-binding protein 1A